MSDSDDEFVSASEGEDDELPVTAPSRTPLSESRTSSEKESTHSSSIIEKEEPAEIDAPEALTTATDDAERTSESEDDDKKAVGDEEKDSGSVVQAAPEKKDSSSTASSVGEASLVEEESVGSSSERERGEWDRVEKEEDNGKCFDSSAKSGVSAVSEVKEDAVEEVAEAGWDDWGAEEKEMEIVSPPTITKASKPVSASPPSGKKEKVEKTAAPAPPADEEDSTDGWDDWGGGENPAADLPAPVEESKLEEGMQRLGGLGGMGESKKAGGEGGSWGWGGMLSGLGETLSSAVESSLGLPSAHDLARHHVEQERRAQEEAGAPVERPPSAASNQGSTAKTGHSAFGMLSGLVTGGLDVLETIGKKTVEAVTVREQDQGRRRFRFEPDRGENLSDVLRELRSRSDEDTGATGSFVDAPARLPDVASAFGRFDSIVHLEALELVAAGRAKVPTGVQRRLTAQLAAECVDEADGEDFAKDIEAAVRATDLPYGTDAIIALDKKLEARLRTGAHDRDAEELFREGVDVLVQYTGCSVHLVSKLASLLAVLGGADFAPFVRVYGVLGRRATHLAHLYMLAIGAADESQGDELGTQILVEATTAVDFIRQAHALLIPLLDSAAAK